MRKHCGTRIPLRCTVALVAVGALAFVVVGAGQAVTSQVGCGDTITQDTKLDSDLIDCPGDGIVIGADDITLDLNGHTISGGGIGIDNSAGHDGVTIQRGAVRGFVRGVLIYGAVGNTVRRLTIQAATGVVVVDDLELATGNVVAGNEIQASWNGVLLEAGPDNIVRGNSVSGAYNGITLFNADDGTRIEHNRLSDNREGIYMSDSFGAALVAENVAAGNCAGIVLVDTHHARIEENRVLRSGENCRALITGVGWAGDGIASLDRENVIEGNVARGNLDDGIDVEGGDVVADNRADRNGDLGIEAEPGVIDGGGNRARGNSNPLQCTNVACS